MTHGQKVQGLLYLAGATFAALLGIITFIIFSERSAQYEQQAQRSTSQKTLKNLKIDRPGAPAISMTHNGEYWSMTDPCQIAINEQRLQPLFALREPSSFTYPASEVDLQAAGLVEPLATVTFNDTKILIGGPDLQGSRRYVQRGGSVEFAPEWILSLLQGGVTALASTELFPSSLSAMSVSDSSNGESQEATTLSEWQTLQASQIVNWPIEDSLSKAIKTYRVDTQENTEPTQWSVVVHETFTAWVKSDSQCAYIVENDVMPSLTQ